MSTPILGWPWPLLAASADGPDAFGDLAAAVWAAYGTTNVQTWTPVWATNGAVQPSAPLQVVGRYQVTDGYCDVALFLSFGPSTNGGRGNMTLTLPVAPIAGVAESELILKLQCPSIPATYFGALLALPGSTTARLISSTSATNSSMTDVRNADSSGAVGTGTPLVAGQFTVQNDGNIVVSGRYQVA